MSENRGINELAPDLIDAFTEIALSHPARPAIACQGRTLTYRQLSALVNDLAEHLGPAPGVVAVEATHTPETVIGLLGVLTAGGSYCPVDPAFPLQRREAILSAVGCRTMVAAQSGSSSQLQVELVELDRLPKTGNSGRVEPGPDEPAYILFTSGSTGRPKPVITPRRAISTAVHSLRGLFGLTPDDRVLQFASLNWDTCFEEILPTLTTGATLVFDTEAHSGSFPRFLRMIERERITVLDLPTAFWHELVLHLAEDRVALPDCLRLVVIGGEAASPARLADWSSLDTGRIRLLNTYGSTETTLITHAIDLHGPGVPSPRLPLDGRTPAPIGRALPHVIQRISDQGELMIGGPAVALGYLGLPEVTEARFAVLGGERCFRTGDRVSSSPDGVLTHQGRLDGEIKVRGIRVDPAEVETQIAGHPDVTAVAVAGAVITGRTVLVAYVVPRSPAVAGTLDADILAYLRGLVPGHLVPSRITAVAELALTASGKVDRAGTHRRYTTPDKVKGDLQ